MDKNLKKYWKSEIELTNSSQIDNLRQNEFVNSLPVDNILEDDKSLSNCGVFAIVIECVVESLAKLITDSVKVPTIGIGASKYCDGQVLVTDDLVGLSDFRSKFVKKYSDVKEIIEKSVKKYCIDVKQRK